VSDGRQFRRLIVPGRKIMADEDRWSVREAGNCSRGCMQVVAVDHVDRIADGIDIVRDDNSAVADLFCNFPQTRRIDNWVVANPPQFQGNVARYSLGSLSAVENDIGDKYSHDTEKLNRDVSGIGGKRVSRISTCGLMSELGQKAKFRT
jgi:hypothetical protein